MQKKHTCIKPPVSACPKASSELGQLSAPSRRGTHDSLHLARQKTTPSNVPDFSVLGDASSLAFGIHLVQRGNFFEQYSTRKEVQNGRAKFG